MRCSNWNRPQLALYKKSAGEATLVVAASSGFVVTSFFRYTFMDLKDIQTLDMIEVSFYILPTSSWPLTAKLILA